MAKKFSKKDNFHPGFVFEYFKLKAFFENDPTIKVGEIDNENHSCEIVCDDAKKAAILDQTLKCKYLKVDVIFNPIEVGEAEIDYLCKDNALYKGMLQMEGGNIKALMFAPVVVPVYTDNYFSPTGYDAYLPTTLAQDLLGEGLNYQTEFRGDDCYCEFACDDDECCDCCCDEDEECWDCDDDCDECDVKDCPLCDLDDEDIEGIKIEIKKVKNAGEMLQKIFGDIADMLDEEE